MLKKSRILLLIICLSFTFLCSCGNKNKEILEDGTYNVSVTLEGGTGKATIESPTTLYVKDGVMTLRVVWSSPNYDYMIANDKKYYNESEAGHNSSFSIPVESVDSVINVIADTTAMSVPHEIEYTITIKLEEVDYTSLTITDEIETKYAIGYTAKWYGQYCYIDIPESGKYFVVPEGHEVPINIPEDVIILKMPLDKTYLVATSAMDMLDAIEALDYVALSGTKIEDWYIDDAKAYMEDGRIAYAGKYSAPDYELIISSGCNLAIESTMIYHSPEVKEKLEALGIPVFVERSSYESHPLGRLEWIKVYGILYGKYAEAKEIYDSQLDKIEPYINKEPSGKTVAFFYVTGNGAISVRKPNDYISKMIGLAGGTYILDSYLLEDDDNALSTMNMQMEDFYAAAKDADYIIYNSTIGGELNNIDELIGLNKLFEDFKAVKNDNVYCTYNNFFQETMGTCDFIEDVYKLLSENERENFAYIKHLK